MQCWRARPAFRRSHGSSVRRRQRAGGRGCLRARGSGRDAGAGGRSARHATRARGPAAGGPAELPRRRRAGRGGRRGHRPRRTPGDRARRERLSRERRRGAADGRQLRGVHRAGRARAGADRRAGPRVHEPRDADRVHRPHLRDRIRRRPPVARAGRRRPEGGRGLPEPLGGRRGPRAPRRDERRGVLGRTTRGGPQRAPRPARPPRGPEPGRGVGGGGERRRGVPDHRATGTARRSSTWCAATSASRHSSRRPR